MLFSCVACVAVPWFIEVMDASTLESKGNHDVLALRQGIARLRVEKKSAKKKVKQWMNAFKKKRGRMPNIEERIIEPQCHLFIKLKGLSRRLETLTQRLEGLLEKGDVSDFLPTTAQWEMLKSTPTQLLLKIFEYLDGYALGSLSNVVDPESPLDIAVTASINRCRNKVEKIKNEVYFQKFRFCTPFIVACEKGELQDVKSLIQNNVPPTARNGGKYSPTYEEIINQMGRNSGGNEYTGLMIASAKEHIHIVNYLLNVQTYAHVDLDIVDSNGNTALHYACAYNANSLELLIVLLDHANNLPKPFDSQFINRRNYNGKSPLDWAIQYNTSRIKARVIKLVQDYGGKVGIDIELTELMFAAKYENFESVYEILRREEANSSGISSSTLTHVTSNGWNALHYAAWKSKRSTDIIMALLKHCTEVLNLDPAVFLNRSDNYGNTPLNMAYVNNSPIKSDIIEALELHDAKRGRK